MAADGRGRHRTDGAFYGPGHPPRGLAVFSGKLFQPAQGRERAVYQALSGEGPGGLLQGCGQNDGGGLQLQPCSRSRSTLSATIRL